jgi:hypothetical protein
VTARLIPFLAIALAACSAGGSGDSPQAQCERQANDDPEVVAIFQQPWVDTYKLSFAKQQAMQKCLRKKGIGSPGGVQPVLVR